METGMKKGIGLLCLTTVLSVVTIAMASQNQSSDETTGKRPDNGEKKEEAKGDLDVTQKVRDQNSKNFASPPANFAKGHVSVRQLSSESLKKNSKGFVVQFPSKAPIPTPTFYKGNLYVSGGFHSKEYYCLNSKGQCVWGITLDDDGPSSCVCDDGVCVFNTESCTIFAVDAKTGKMLWSHWLGDPLMSTPTIANGKVFTAYPVQGGGGFQQQEFGGDSFFPDDPKQPEKRQPEKSQTDQSKKESAAPTDSGNTAKKRPPCSHAMACLDLKTGRILWQRWIDSDVMSAPVANGDEIYAATFAGTVYRFQQTDGKVLSAIQSRATSAPVIVGKDVFFTRRADDANSKVAEESILRLTREGNKKVFEKNRTRALHLDHAVQSKTRLAEKGQQLDANNGFSSGAPAAANPNAALYNIGQGGVYTCQAWQGSRVLNCGKWNFNCQGDQVFCTDAETGQRKWAAKLGGDLEKLGGALAAPPVLAGGHLFLATVSGEILQINPANGKTETTYTVGSAMRTQPIIQDGNIYVGTQDGKLVCIQTGNLKLTGWSCWGGNIAHSGTLAAN